MKRLAVFLSAAAIAVFCSCSRISPDNSVEPVSVIGSDETLLITSPYAGENLKPGNTYTIQWDIPSAVKNVGIALYRKKNYTSTIVDSTSNSGVMQWSVPSDIIQSVHYQIKIYDTRYPDINYIWSSNFYIKSDWP